MILGSARRVVLGAVGLIVVLGVGSSLLAQATGATSPQPAVSVPFVGCASSGQVESLEAPKGTGKSIQTRPDQAELLAYFKSAGGLSILGPHGWYCQGASGSSGSTLYLSPKPIRHSESGWEGLEGPAVELNRITSDASGRYQIAEIIMRVFPGYKAIPGRILNGMDLDVPSGPYPKDTLKYIGKTIIEYKTPAQMEGLGNIDSWLKKNDIPIVGAVILIVDPSNPIGDPPNLVRLAVRLSPDLAPLTEAIVRYVEHDVAGAALK
jgi:hypothetical protein